MLIHPISSVNATFGQKNNDNKKSLILPGAITGAAIGAGYAHFNKIKANPDNIDEIIKIFKDKIPHTFEQDCIVKNLENNQSALLKRMKQTFSEKLGINKDTKEITIETIFNKIVGNDKKTLDGIDEDIKFISGELKHLKDNNKPIEEIKEKALVLDERKGFKKILTETKKDKLTVEELENCYKNTIIKENSNVKHCMNEVNNIIKNFNSKRLWIFGLAGAAVGAVVGHLIKSSKN